jgi:hypothetical protein
VVYNDALKKGMGCVLMQHGRLIAYASRQLKLHEVNYPVMTRTCSGGVFPKSMTTLFDGSQVQIFTDHKSLKYLMS